MKDSYLVTIEVRLQSYAENKNDAQLNTLCRLVNPKQLGSIEVEWLGAEVIACVKEK